MFHVKRSTLFHMIRVFTSKSQKIGETGEGLAVKYLVQKGFQILERNFTRPYGEIDIVALKDKVVHMIEVKSVSCDLEGDRSVLVRPEENMHPKKIERFVRVSEVYADMKKLEGDFKLDLALVYIDDIHRKAKVVLHEDFL